MPGVLVKSRLSVLPFLKSVSHTYISILLTINKLGGNYGRFYVKKIWDLNGGAFASEI